MCFSFQLMKSVIFEKLFFSFHKDLTSFVNIMHRYLGKGFLSNPN